MKPYYSYFPFKNQAGIRTASNATLVGYFCTTLTCITAFVINVHQPPGGVQSLSNAKRTNRYPVEVVLFFISLFFLGSIFFSKVAAQTNTIPFSSGFETGNPAFTYAGSTGIPIAAATSPRSGVNSGKFSVNGKYDGAFIIQLPFDLKTDVTYTMSFYYKIAGCSGSLKVYRATTGGTYADIVGGTLLNTTTTNQSNYTQVNMTFTVPANVANYIGFVSTMTTNGCSSSNFYIDDISITQVCGTAPVISAQPVAQTKCIGQAASFSVTATGTGPLTYQWKKNGTDVPGATTSTYSIASVAAGDVAAYTVTVANFCGTTLSSASASLTIPSAAAITAQPTNRSVCQGSQATFTVAATGSGLTYQWYLGGTPLANSGNISGATTATLAIAAASPADAASNYSVTVTGTCGSPISSSTVSLSLNSLPGSPTGTNSTRCGPGSLDVSAIPSSGETIDWFSATSGGSVLVGGSGVTTFTTPALTTSTNYHAQARVVATGCVSSTRIPVTAFIKALPTAPPGTNGANCGAGTVNISVTPASGEIVNWFAASSGGGVLTGGTATPTFTTPLIAATTVYYAEVMNTSTGCFATTRSAVTALITEAPVITTQPSDLTSCNGSSASFTVQATGDGLSYQWYIGLTPLTNTGNVSGATSATLLVSPVSGPDARSDYHVVVTGSCAPSVTSASVALAVIDAPGLSPGTDAARCGSGTVSLGATPGAGETIDWYSSASGGSILSGGNGTASFVTPSISSTTVFYAQTRNTSTGCVSQTRTAVSATINPNPTVLTSTGGSVCGSGSVSISAGASVGAVIDWYAVSSGGSVLPGGIGTSSFTTPTISASTIYYAEARNTNSGCLSTTRTAVTVIVNPAVASPTGINASSCGPGSISLAATPLSGETIDWYAASSGGTVLSGGLGTTSFATPTISSSTTYFASARNSTSGCVSSTRTAVTATVNALPTSPGGTGAARCGTGGLTLAATPASGETIDWYAAASGGSLLLSDAATYNIPSISATTTYYAASRNTGTGCISPRTEITATINPLPIANAGAAQTICAISPATIGGSPAASGGTGAYSYSWTPVTSLTNATIANPVASPASTTTYSLVVTDAAGCVSAPATVSLTYTAGGTKTWALAGGGDFNTPANWSPAGVPSSCDSVIINMNGTITFSGNATIRALNIRVTGANNYSFFDVGSRQLTVLGTTTAAMLGGNSNTSFKFNVRSGGVVTLVGDYSASSFDAQAKIYPINGEGGATTGQFIFKGNVTLGTGGWATVSEMPGKVIFDAPGTQTLNESSGGFAFGNTSTEIGWTNAPTVIATGTSRSNFSIGDLNINCNSVLDLTTSTFNRYTSGGTVRIGPGATLKLAAATGGKTGSNFPNNFTTISIDPTSTVEYNSASGVNQTVFAPVSYGNLVISNATGSGTSTKNLTANITGIVGNLAVNSFNTFDLQTYTANRTASNGDFSLASNAVMKLSAGSGGQTGSNFPNNFTAALHSSSTVEYDGIVAQTIYATPVYGHLTISNNSSKTAAAGLTILGNVLIQTNGVLASGAYAHLVAGNWTNNASVNGLTSSGLTTFNGNTAQTIGGTFSSSFNNLTINNSNGVTLAQGEIVNGLLTLTAGNLTLQTFNLTLNGSAAVAGSGFSASKMIVADGGGEVRKSFSGNGSYLFPIGDNTGGADYSPVTLSVTGSSYASAWIGASVVDAKHPNNQSSTHFLTRYWKLNQSGIGNCSAGLTGTYINNSSDISGTEASASSAQLKGTFNQLTNPWIKFQALNANILVASNAVLTPAETSVFTGITLAPPSVTVGGGGVSICNGSSTALTSSVTGDPGFAYAWSPAAGLSSSIAANPTATPAITSTYSIVAYDGNGITATAATTPITIIARPTGIISGSSAICPGGSVVVNIALTGTGPWTGTLSDGSTFSGSASPISVTVSPASTRSYTITTLSDVNCTSIGVDRAGSATVTVNTPPSFSSLPVAATRCAGSSQTFSVVATGTGLLYQWRKDGVNIAGATSASYLVATVNTGHAGSYDVVVSGACAPSITSPPVALTINTLPLITTQPVSATVCNGQSNTFSVVASGTSLNYQWRKDGVNIGGATAAGYTIPSVSGTHAGAYDVLVGGACTPSVSSTIVSLAVNTAPAITTNPVGQSVCVGTAVNLSVLASAGTGTGLSYQWHKNGVSIPGATGNAYTIISATVGDAGNYSVVVTSCGSAVTSAAAPVVISSTGTWIGVNSNWNDAQNWCGGAVPGINTDVSIPAVSSGIYPMISSVAYTRDITINANATLVVNNTTLQVAGVITNSGLVTAESGTIHMNGTTTQSIPANVFQNNRIKNLVIGNTSAGGVSLGGELQLSGSLTYSGTGKTLATNDHLTLRSTADNTAWVGDMTGNTITGKVTVERYISVKRAWRFLSVPVNTSQTIKQAWQEGAANTSVNPVGGYGIQITTNAGSWASNGFDLQSPAPSMKYYNSATGNFVPLSSTNIQFPYPRGGYFTFVRGDRTASVLNSVATQTVMRTKGNLYTGTQAAIIINPSVWEAIGNPYASAIDMRNINKTGIKDFFYVWDPALSGTNGLGAYQTFSLSGADYVVTPGMGSFGTSGSVSNYIQSGQAFFVQATTSGGSISFSESAKASGSRLASRPVGDRSATLRTNLYGVNADGSTYMADGTFINYDDDHSNTVDDMDALKSGNTNENFGIKSAGKLLVIERRRTIEQKDTVYFSLKGSRVQPYRLEFLGANLQQPGLLAFLEDVYLGTKTPVTLEGKTLVNFTVTSVAASYAPDRFRLVFQTENVLPVRYTSVTARSQTNGVEVHWKVDNQLNIKTYQVERSLNGTSFSPVHSIMASNHNSDTYVWIDPSVSTGSVFYRIRNTDHDGNVQYSRVVEVKKLPSIRGFEIYPNPVMDHFIGLQFNNQPKGIYYLKLITISGQELMKKTINHSGEDRYELINIGHNLSKGIYKLEVVDLAGKLSVSNVHVN